MDGQTEAQQAQVVGSARLMAGMTRSTTAGDHRRKALPLTGRGSRILQETPRVVERINPELRDLLVRMAAGQERWPLYLFGTAGVGKTCATLWLMDQVPESYFCTPQKAIEWVLAGNRDWWGRIATGTLVIVDEIGLRSAVSDLEYSAVKQLADAREHRPAIWIGNHEPARIRDQYDDRIYSRICCGPWFELTGPDQRMG